MNSLSTDNNAPNERRGYEIRIDNQVFNLNRPEPTARELLAMVGRNPTDFFLVFSIEGKPDLVLELDETFDLRATGTEVLLVVSRERRFNIQIDEGNFTVKGPFLTGAKVLELVGKNPKTHFVTQILVGADDIVVKPEDSVDLTIPGRERFTVVAMPCPPQIWKVDIDGTIYDWHKDTITTEELIDLGHLNATEGVIVIDAENNERTLAPGETVHLVEGICFGRKVRFRRG